MRLTVVTAVLLLVGALNTVTADIDCPSIWDVCQEVPHMPCGDGWTRFDENRCVKYVKTAKTFQDAQDECRSSDGDLISIHSLQQVVHLLCLTSYNTARSEPQAAWIGAKRSGENFAFTDGSEFNYKGLHFGEPDNVGGEDN
ncbi:C-type isolectin Sp-CL4-like [Sebastes fasciatus]|uniref:C-type isolectin Sp-CL4-like n=1 Tax=Sebastes fasciatus TaxID=394691 RepID=UPI003D9E6EEE